MQICLNCLNTYEENQQNCPHCGFGKWKYKPNDFCLELGLILKNQYQVGTVIGSGGFGITYRAVDMQSGNPVAIKEYFPNGMVSRNMDHRSVQLSAIGKEMAYAKGMNSFLEEARGLARFRGVGNIVQVYDYFEQNGTAYIVMEYLRGKSLAQYTADHGGRLDCTTVINFIMSVLHALEAVHTYGMVHRDISPDNIFVQNNGEVKLIDFGAARESYGYEDKTLSIVLKPNYAPPEQFKKKSRQGPWTDIYALGATMYKVLTGTMPQESVSRFMEDELLPPSRYNTTVPSYFDTIIMKMMALQIENRYQSIEQLQKEIMKHVTVNPSGNRNAQLQQDMLYQATNGQGIQSGASLGQNSVQPSAQMSRQQTVSEHRSRQNTGMTQNAPKKDKSRTTLIIILIVAIACIVAAIISILVSVKKENGSIPVEEAGTTEAVSTAEADTTTEATSTAEADTTTEATSTTEADATTERAEITTEATTEVATGYVDYGYFIYELDPILYVDSCIFGYTVDEIVRDSPIMYYKSSDTGNYLAMTENDLYTYIVLGELDGNIGGVMIVAYSYTDEDVSNSLDTLELLYGEPISSGESSYTWMKEDMYVIFNVDEEGMYIRYFSEAYYDFITSEE